MPGLLPSGVMVILIPVSYSGMAAEVDQVALTHHRADMSLDQHGMEWAGY